MKKGIKDKLMVGAGLAGLTLGQGCAKKNQVPVGPVWVPPTPVYFNDKERHRDFFIYTDKNQFVYNDPSAQRVRFRIWETRTSNTEVWNVSSYVLGEEAFDILDDKLPNLAMALRKSSLDGDIIVEEIRENGQVSGVRFRYKGKVIDEYKTDSTSGEAAFLIK